MVLLKSTDSEFFKSLAPFKLLSVNNDVISSDELISENGLVVLFTCNHCPYAIALWNRVISDYNKIQKLGFNLVAINPNINPDYPADSFDEMKKLSFNKKLPFNYLVDETQAVAKQYDAQCTPDIFVINKDHKLLYRGAYDDNWKDEQNIKQHYLINALNFYNSNSIKSEFKTQPSMGCSIKWVNV